MRRIAITSAHLASNKSAAEAPVPADDDRICGPTDSIRVHFAGRTKSGFPASFYQDDEIVFEVGGEGEVMPPLQEAVIGMRLGEEKDFIIEPEVGEHPMPRRDESKVFEVPLEQLPVVRKRRKWIL